MAIRDPQLAGSSQSAVHSAYDSAIRALFARTGTTAKLGLDRTSALLERLGNPHLAFQSFHVAGTNGKGSVVAMLYALLRSKGFSVGRYTSPHLIDFRERIVVDDEQISEEEVLDFLGRWEPEGERLGATFFEITTVMAFDHFARRGVDVAVIETGMGGRLDATNVISPVATAVTSVGMDHMEYLGATLADIAVEKAGIFKPDVPAVIGDLATDADVEVRRVATETGAPLIEAASLYAVGSVVVTADGTELEVRSEEGVQSLRLGLTGRTQATNVAVALAMLHSAGERYRATAVEAAKVLPTVRLPGRFQRLGKFVLDVAHNVDGMEALRETLCSVSLPRPTIAVVAILRDKSWMEMLLALAPAVDGFVLTRPSSVPPDRVWDLDAVYAEMQGGSTEVRRVAELADALQFADAMAPTVLVTGSFYTVGESLALLQRGGGRD